MNCCSQHTGLNRVFNAETARREVEAYRQRGPERADRALAERIIVRGAQGADVLEIGGGIGAVQIELLRAGAARTTDLDISSGYVDAARTLADSLGMGERAEHRVLDFAREAEGVPRADIVIMNRVVCCYPDMPALVTPAAERAQRLLVLVFPRDTWWVRLGMRVMNGVLQLVRHGFRAYAHSNAEIISLAAAQRLEPVLDQTSGIWRTVLFQRRASA